PISTVSPRVARTAPSAWRATRPDSSLRVFPPHSISTVFVLNIFVPSTRSPYCERDSLSGNSVPRAVRGAFWPRLRPAELRDFKYAKRPALGPPQVTYGDRASK